MRFIKKIRWVGAVIATAFSLLPFSASAQDALSEAAAEADSVAVLDRKVSKLEKIVSKLPSISGFVQFQYSWVEDESTFQIRRARVTLKGKIYKDFADYCIMPDFAGSVKLLDAYVRITPFRQLNLQAGSFRPSFTLENVFYGATSMEAIDYPQVVKKMTTLGDISGVSGGGRDIGLQLYGGFFNKRGFNTLEYRIGVFNGAGISAKDTNKSKDIAAMLRVNPVKNLALVGSLYYGEWSPATASGGKTVYYDRHRWSAGFLYDDKKFFARGEYIWGMTGGIKGYEGNLKSEGAYVMAGVWFLKHTLAPLVRVEYYAENIRARKETAQPFYTVGVDYRPFKYLRFQVNYTRQTFTDAAVKSRNQIHVMLTGMF